MSIVFDKSLETGDERIDSQHRELIDRINKLLEACSTGKEKESAVRTLDFLMDYVEEHFADEERLQKEADYPEYEAHKAEHDRFVQTVDELRQMLEEEEGPTPAFVNAVKRNIVDWLLNHIEAWDRDVAVHVNE